MTVDSITYQDFRQYVIDTYTTLAIINDSNNVETYIDIPNDSRAQWVSGASTNPATVEATITGSDSDISRPTTITRLELYPSQSGNRRFADPCTNRTIEASGDEVTVTADAEIPDL